MHTGEFLIYMSFGDQSAMPLWIDYTQREGEEVEWTATITYVVPDAKGMYARHVNGKPRTDHVDVADLLTTTQKRLIESEIAADIARTETYKLDYEENMDGDK